MSSENNGPNVTFQAGEAVTHHALVMLEAASATIPPEVIETTGGQNADLTVLGTVAGGEDGPGDVADGDPVNVRMLNCVATAKMIAAKAIAVGDACFSAADGKVTDATTSESFIGIAVEAAADDGDIIEVAIQTQTYDAVDAT